MEYHLSSVVLLALSVSALTTRAIAPEDVYAWADREGQIHVRWTTKAPAKGYVQWGTRPHMLNRVVEEDGSCLRGTTNNRDSGEGWANNHRADFAGTGEWPLFAKIRGKTRDESAIEGAVVTIRKPASQTTAVKAGRVEVNVDPGDWALDVMPLTFGVPFPPGALDSASQVRVIGQNGALPTQARVVTRWYADSSVKWLRVDTLAPRAERTLTLKYGPTITRPDPHPQKWPGPPLSLTRDIVLTDAQGGLLHFAPGRRPVLEEIGPMKAVCRFSGPLQDGQGRALCRAVIRVHQWQNLPVTRLDVTLENDAVRQEMTAIRSFEVGFPWTGNTARIGRGETTATLNSGARLLQCEDFEWEKPESGQRGKRIDGVCCPAGGPAIVFRHFWEQWPSSIELRNGRLVLGLCPRLPETFYAGRDDEDKYYYHIRDGFHTFRQGWSKTWELWQAPGEAADGLAGEMPVASVPPKWIEDSGALRRIAVSVRDQFPGYDEALAKGIDGYTDDRDRRREYGMMNFGDWYGERRWNWGNLEYDLGHGFLTQFARTGYAPFRRRADAIIRHQRDVDTRHYARDPRRVGQQWIHSIGHTAGYYTNDYKKMKAYAGRGWSDNRGHVWAQGMFEHYLLGGDTRSWNTALLVADWAAGPQTTNFRFGNAREPGWMSKLVMSAYYSTEDPFYLNAAKIMLDATHARSVATGDHGFYYHKLPKGHCNCDDDSKHYGEAGFMLGVLMTGMKMYYDATGNPTVAADIAKTARFIVDSMWEPADCGFHYTSCPNTNASSGSAWIMMEGLAFGARHAQDTRLADVCREAMVGAWHSVPRSGKGAGSILSNAPQALQEVAQLPGIGFREYRKRQERILSSPARRDLPTRVPNPDFEGSIRGWPTRGWAIEQTTTVRHGGAAALHISGERDSQNEYVNTRYNTSNSPFEITWLEAGKTYLLTAWLRVDRITPGTPAPNLRLAYRDNNGTRGSEKTTAYDLGRMGTWQQLSGAMTIPEWNTRNYIALNTNTRDMVEVDMYLDDVHVTPVDAPPPATPLVVRLAPDEAALTGGAKAIASPAFRGQAAVTGPGNAAWSIDGRYAGTYVLWARTAQKVGIRRVTAGNASLASEVAAEEPGWIELGPIVIPGSGCELRIEGISPGGHVGRLVLTNVP